MRRKLLKIISELNQEKKPCFLNVIAKKIKFSHVATKKHIDLLVEEGYLEQINPKGKPVFLKLSSKGKNLIKEFDKK